MFLAVTVQAHQPSGSDAAIKTAQRASFIHGASTTNASHAHKVPVVPGALGLRPEPKPSASRCAGCDSMKRALGRTGPGDGGAAKAGGARPSKGSSCNGSLGCIP